MVCGKPAELGVAARTDWIWIGFERLERAAWFGRLFFYAQTHTKMSWTQSAKKLGNMLL